MSGSHAVVRRIRALGLTEREAEETVGIILKSVVEGLAKEGGVSISGFGRFSVRQRQPRTVRLPGRDPRRIPAKKTVHFKASTNVFRRGELS